MSYYDGTKLLSMKDINGEQPELYLAVGNRTGGKTTWFSRYCLKKFLDKGEKFALLYRFDYEMTECADKFFKDIRTLFFRGHEMTSEPMAKGTYHELYIDDEHCGYALSLNKADAIKRFSHLFSDVSRIFFDEFQSETNHYCANEIKKLLSLHTSLARGQGKQVKHLPVYMASNAVSLINPYYTALGISGRLKKDTKILRGDGFVLEQAYIESAAKAIKESPFNRAFASSEYIAYASQNVYLNDNLAFVSQPSGRGQYCLTIKYNGKEYGVLEYENDGIVYVSDRADSSFKFKIAVTTDDHNVNYVMLKNNSMTVQHYRFLFENGCFRFKNLQCKEALMTLLSY